MTTPANDPNGLPPFDEYRAGLLTDLEQHADEQAAGNDRSLWPYVADDDARAEAERPLKDRVSDVFRDPKYGHDPGWLRINVLGVIASWQREQASHTPVLADREALAHAIDRKRTNIWNAGCDNGAGREPLTKPWDSTVLAVCDVLDDVAAYIRSTTPAAPVVADVDPIARVREQLYALGQQWLRDQSTYPDTEQGRAAAAAVRLCKDELAREVARLRGEPRG